MDEGGGGVVEPCVSSCMWVCGLICRDAMGCFWVVVLMYCDLMCRFEGDQIGGRARSFEYEGKVGENYRMCVLCMLKLYEILFYSRSMEGGNDVFRK